MYVAPGPQGVHGQDRWANTTARDKEARRVLGDPGFCVDGVETCRSNAEGNIGIVVVDVAVGHVEGMPPQ